MSEVECVLRGVVPVDALDALLLRLDSFCDVETKVELSYHEKVYRGEGIQLHVSQHSRTYSIIQLRTPVSRTNAL
eukprot:m.61199 g.61199  ORF g.61199 m.61199 type:complete len:75 (-) comp17529_c0_seq3:1424-1648(-)